MKNNPKIEEIHRKIVNVQANNLEITKIYCEFIEDILYDEEKIEKYKKTIKKYLPYNPPQPFPRIGAN